MALHYTTLRGARLVHRDDISIEGATFHDGRFIDGDIIEFPDIAITPSALNIEGQCFRVGAGGSTLTPVARGSWLK